MPRSYRAAPHGSTGVSPNQLMFGRNQSSRLPSINMSQPTPIIKSALKKYAETTEKNREYADEKLCTKPSNIKVGDKVLLKAKKVNKLSPIYSPEILTVVARNKSWVLEQRQ